MLTDAAPPPVLLPGNDLADGSVQFPAAQAFTAQQEHPLDGAALGAEGGSSVQEWVESLLQKNAQLLQRLG